MQKNTHKCTCILQTTLLRIFNQRIVISIMHRHGK